MLRKLGDKKKEALARLIIDDMGHVNDLFIDAVNSADKVQVHLATQHAKDIIKKGRMTSKDHSYIISLLGK